MQARDSEHLKKLIDLGKVLEEVDKKIQDARVVLHETTWDLIKINKDNEETTSPSSPSLP